MFRNFVFAEHNWHDYEAYERMVRTQNYMYILNGRPNQPLLGAADAVGIPSYKDLKSLEAQGKLSAIQADIFVTPRPKEELYDLKKDLNQIINLASSPDYQVALGDLRSILDRWMDETGDMGGEPEDKQVLENEENGLRQYYERLWKQRGLSPDIAPEDYLKFWEKELGVTD